MTQQPRRKTLDRDELARRLADACLLGGDFTLRSGAHSSTYFDKYQFEADPRMLAGVARSLASMVPEEIEVLAGLELGGIPVATALSLATGLPAAFVRKTAKTYGTERLAEGHGVADRQVLVVEDVVTSGGQIVRSASGLREAGAIVEHAVCVVDRGGADALAAEGIKLHSLYAITELHAARSTREPVRSASRAPGPGSADRDDPGDDPGDETGDAPGRPGGPAAPTIGTATATTVADTGDADRAGAPAARLLPQRASRSPSDRKVAPPLLPRRSNDPT